jgi:Flp pilus assembly protein TadD
MDDAGWQKFKNIELPSLYQSMGLLNLVKGDRDGAKARLAKAVELAPTDPFNHLLLAGILNDEYQDAAARYRSMPSGPAKDEELKKILTFLDQVIDAYAHTIALAEGNQRLAPVRTQYLQDLEAYYKYRHNKSTAGMQQLIDKYKLPAKP